jgi:hypothetical protein
MSNIESPLCGASAEPALKEEPRFSEMEQISCSSKNPAKVRRRSSAEKRAYEIGPAIIYSSNHRPALSLPIWVY